MARNTRIFSDLDLNFAAHPVTGDIIRRFDENAIKQSLKNLLLTRNFERPFHSEIGSPIRALMFEPAGPMFSVMLERSILDVITNFEPRVEVTSVTVDDYSDANAVGVSIEFKIVNTERPITLDIALERTR
jgi:phage baseplate assembly protein W